MQVFCAKRFNNSLTTSWENIASIFSMEYCKLQGKLQIFL